LDIRNNCKGIYHQQEFKFKEYESLLDNYSVAWKHSPIIQRDENLFYLYVAVRGATLESYSPNEQDFKRVYQKIKSQQKAAATAKISLEDSCFYDVMPKSQLLEWYREKELCLIQAHRQVKKESDYEILHKAHVLTTNIKNQKITYNYRPSRVMYNIFGSATGRLTTQRSSVPVLTMDKKKRKQLTPTNDVFVEIDLNAAEIRTLIALQGQEQPQEDIHEWIKRTVFSDSLSREDVKKKVFSWLYNFSAPKSRLDKFFSRQIFRDFYSYDTEILKTPFGRNLKVEERKAQNYLLQSTTSDQVVENAYKIQKFLHGKKSKLAFLLHDSIILDMSKEDAIMLKDIKLEFEKTRWGNFVSSCKIGKNFADLRELEI